MTSIKRVAIGTACIGLFAATIARADVVPSGPEYQVADRVGDFATGGTNGDRVFGYRWNTARNLYTGQFYAADGSKQGGPVVLPILPTIGSLSNPHAGPNSYQVALEPDGHIIGLWVEYFIDSNNADLYGYLVRLQVFNTDGSAATAATTLETQEIPSPQWQYSEPDLAVSVNASGKFVVSWDKLATYESNIPCGIDVSCTIDQPALRAQAFHANGSSSTPVITAFQASTPSHGGAAELGIANAIDGLGNFSLAWSYATNYQYPVKGAGIFARNYGANGKPLAAAVQVGPALSSPSLNAINLLTDGNYRVSYYDSQANVIDAQTVTAAGGLSGTAVVSVPPISTAGTIQGIASYYVDAAGDSIINYLFSNFSDPTETDFNLAQEYAADGSLKGGTFTIAADGEVIDPPSSVIPATRFYPQSDGQLLMVYPVSSASFNGYGFRTFTVN